MATESPAVTLLKNIRENLKDTTNFPEVDAFKGSVRIAPFLQQLYARTPYAVIVPEGETGGEEQIGWQDTLISVYVVVRDASDPINERALDGTLPDIDAVDTLAKVVRDALVRDEPYQHAPFTSGVYTEQQNVTICVHNGTGAFTPVPRLGRDEPEQGVADLQIARPVSILYRVYDE